MSRYDTLIMMSGGIESTLLTEEIAKDRSGSPYLISFQTGLAADSQQRFRAKTIAFDLGIPVEIVDLSGIQSMLSVVMAPQFAIMDEADTYPCNDPTFIPVLIVAAIYFAGAKGINNLQIGLTKEQMRPQTDKFLKGSGDLLHNYDPVLSPVQVSAPLSHLTKAEVIKRADSKGINLAETWSCFLGESIHCGVCPSCQSRKHAFSASGVADPTSYKQ